MIVLLDMDDVLDDLLPAWVNWLNEKHGQSVSVEDITQWDMPAAYPELTGEQVYAPLETEEFWKTVPPKEGAVEGVRKLLDEGFEVYVVTSSSYKTLKYKTEHVLLKYFPMLTWKNVIVTDRKQLIRGDILVDDGIHNLIEGEYLRVLMDAPHNRGIDDSLFDIFRAHNWNEVYSYISIAGRKPTYRGVKAKRR